MAVKPLDLGAYLKEKGSPLAGYVPDIMASANRHRIDPRFIVAVAGAESSFGKISKGFNAWGIGPHYRYASWKDGIEAAAKLLRTYYVNEGRKSVLKIGEKWAPIGAGNDPTNLNSNWSRNVKSIYSALGGDPNDVTKGWRKGAAPKVVEKLPSQNPGMLTAAPPPRDLLTPSPLAGAAGLTERTAFEGLTRIGRGESPTRTLRDLTSAAMQEASAVAAAAATVADTQPGPIETATDEDSIPRGNTVTKPAPLKAGGGWGGSYSIAKSFADIGKSNGLAAVSEKRGTKKTKTGGTSDHWVGSAEAYAFDLSNTGDGGEPTPEMDRAAIAIAAKLGIKYDGKTPLVLTVKLNGYRIQVLYRTQLGGDHNDHIHVGVRKL